MSTPIQISLPNHEALVLFEVVARFGKTGTLSVFDPAETQAIHNLECLLERELPDVFASDYASRVTAAKAKLTRIGE